MSLRRQLAGIALSRYLRETRLAVRRPVRRTTLRAPNILVPLR